MLLLAMFVAPWAIQAQTLADNYAFATGVDNTKWETLSSPTLLLANFEDDEASAVTNIGFSFDFCGQAYTQFSISSNGCFRLGSSATSGGTQDAMFNAGNLTNLPKITGIGCDMGTGYNGGVYYKLLGEAPNRTFVCEFRMGYTYGDDENADVKWQIQLEEGTNKVRIVYGPTPGILPSAYHTGLASTATDIVMISPATHAPTYHNSAVSNTFSSLWHGADRYYEFTPTVFTCPKPTAIVASNIEAYGFDVSWTDTSDATSWIVALSSDDTVITSVEYSTMATFTDLNAATNYTVAVAGLCMNGDTSNFRSLQVLTPCVGMAVPFFENFDNFSSSTADPLPTCWYKMSDYTSNYPYASTSYNHGAGSGKAMYMYSTSTTYSLMVLPMMAPAIDSLQVSFWLRKTNTSYTHDLYVGVMTDPTDITTFVAVDTVACVALNTWEEMIVSLDGYTGTGSYIAIMSPSGSYSYPYLDDLTVSYIPACPRVENLAVSNIDVNNVDLSWTEVGNATSWLVEYGPAGFVRGSEAGTIEVASDTIITLMGLNGNTAYDAYVEPDCAGDIAGVHMISFRTACVALDSLPYIYGFEDAATGTSSTGSPFGAPCWNRLNNGTSYSGYPYVSSSSTYNHTVGGARGLYWYNTTTLGTYGDYQCVVLPAVDTDIFPINTLQLKFWAKSSSTSYSPSFQIGVMSDPYDITTFQQVGTANVGPNTNWSEFITYFGSFEGVGQYLAVKAERPASNWYAYVDDFTIDIMPACVPVSEIALAAIDSNMLSVTWQENGEATSWAVEYGPHGFTPGSGTSESVTTLPFDIYGLTANTEYDIYIVPDCSDGAADTAMATFRTANVYIALPFECDFEDTVQNTLWTLENGANTNAWYIGSATNNGGTNSLYISNDNGVSNSYTISVSTMSYAYVDVMIPSPGLYTYTFDWKSYGESTLDFVRAALVPVSQALTAGTSKPSGFTATSLPTGWISLDGNNKLNLQSSWQNRTDDVYITSAGVYHLVFAFTCDGSVGTMPPAAIDNVAIARVDCAKPLNVTCTAIDQHTASFSWVEPGESTEWEYQIGDQPAIGTTDTFCTVNSLLSNTDYTFRVRSICGSGDTSFWSTLSIRTACDPITLPYTQDFEAEATGSSTTGSAFPPCMRRLNNGTSYGGYPYVSNSTTYNHTVGGTKGLYWYCTTTTGTYGDYQVVVLPPVDSTVDVAGLQLKFWAKASSTSYSPVFKVGVMTNPDDVTSFVGLDTFSISGNTDWHEFEAPLVNYTGTGTYVAIKADRPTSSWYAYVDDITLESIGACIRPDSLYAVNATASSVDLGWRERGSASEWIVEYGPRGFALGTGVQVSTTSNPVSITGLPASYDGEFYVKALCNSGDTGEYTNLPCAFSTSQLPATIPYLCNFDDSASWAGWQTNSNCNYNWYRGTARAYNGSYSMYISPDGGLTWADDHTTMINASAFRDIDFGSVDTSFTISFNAKVGGTTDAAYDGLMVFLVDPAVAVEAPTAAITSPWGSVNDLYRIATARLDTTWHLYTGTFDNISGVHRVAFFYFSQNTAASHTFIGGPAAVDNISIDYAACPRPTDLDATDINSRSVTLTWNGPVSASYRVLYRVNGSSLNRYVDVNTNTATIGGLDPMTNYLFFVRKDCGGETSPYSDGISVVTSMCDNATEVYSYDAAMSPSTSNYGPIGYSFYNYSYTQTLVDSAQLAGLDGDISAFAFSPSTASQGAYFNHVDVYFANVSESNLGFGFIMPDANHTFVKVLNNGNLNYTDVGWNFVALDSTFTWDGHSNLLVAINRRHGSYASGASFNSHVTTDVRTRYINQDGSAYDPTTVSATSGTAGSFVGDLMFVACGQSCDVPTFTSETHTFESITVNWAGSGNSYQVAIKANDEAEWPAETAVTGRTYTFNGLADATTYSIRVRQNCTTADLGYSDWAYTTITTDEIPCAAPDDLAVSNITHSSATFNWSAAGTEDMWNVHVWAPGVYDHTLNAITAHTTARNLIPGVTYSAAIRSRCGADRFEGAWSDTITFSTPTCPDVTGLSVGNVTFNTVELSWAANDMAQGYEIEYGYRGFNQGQGTTIQVSTNNHVVTGLYDETAYDFYVRALCASDWYSENWASVSATTLEATGDTYVVTLLVNDPAMGTVLGGGTYAAGSTVSISATPNAGFQFVNWSDDNTEATRSIVVNSDITLTANFASANAIDEVGGATCTIYPNPATSSTTISVAGVNGQVRIAVVDMNGRVVATEMLECAADCEKTMAVDNLAQGAYFVRIVGQDFNMVKKLVVR